MKIIRKYALQIILILFTIFFAFYGIYEYNSTYKFMTSNYNSLKSKCEQMDNGVQDLPYYCEEIDKSGPPIKLDAFNLTFYVINYTLFSNILPFLPLIIIAIGIKSIYSKFKSGMFRNIILVEGYKKYIVSCFKQILKYAILIPFLIIFIFIISSIYTKSFDYTSIFKLEMNYIPTEYNKNMSLFCSLYLINLFLHSLFWLNLGMICMKKAKNYIISIITSYILYLGYSIIMEITFGFLISGLNLFRKMNIYGYVKPGNIWGYDGINSLVIMLIYSIILAILSLIIVIFKYKKKESVIIANEI